MPRKKHRSPKVNQQNKKQQADAAAPVQKAPVQDSQEAQAADASQEKPPVSKLRQTMATFGFPDMHLPPVCY